MHGSNGINTISFTINFCVSDANSHLFNITNKSNLSLFTIYLVNNMIFLIFCFSGFLLFKDFCLNEIDEAVPQLKFYEEVRDGQVGPKRLFLCCVIQHIAPCDWLI